MKKHEQRWLRYHLILWFVTKKTNVNITFAGFEVLTAVIMKSTIFWNVTLCSPLKVNGLHSVICQKIILFNITFAVFWNIMLYCTILSHVTWYSCIVLRPTCNLH
jgi:hypothetical protein